MKRIIAWLIFLFPVFAFADAGSLSFAPPPSDYSMVFLGNLFGIVDGVLHGTGSQIMGSMFAVFNSAVLALGGMVIMYTLLVSTMNTAHEGQMLGQKWNSIWVPIRSTVGLALLIPKASGYCLMQIFIMWIVVQGVGAADKVWDAALDYLNKGGVIVQAQMSPTTSLTAAHGDVAQGASMILNGQVCMLGLQTVLQMQRDLYMKNKQNQAGPCYLTLPTSDMSAFCNTAVPDFIGTVNMVAIQNAQNTVQNVLNTAGLTDFSAPMPNFDSTSPYSVLNGICGTIKWKVPGVDILRTAINNVKNVASGIGHAIVDTLTGNPIKALETEYNTSKNLAQSIAITVEDVETARLSRAIAIQQMYVDMSAVAQVMVNNDPQLSMSVVNAEVNSKFPFVPQQSNTSAPFSTVATSQFGVPYSASAAPCTSSSTCVGWGSASGGKSNSVLFSGTEFQGAIADYNGIMMPTLRLLAMAQNGLAQQKATAFIATAKTQGWLMAGSYFFDLAQLNQGNTNSNATDSDTGLSGSSFSTDALTSPFGTHNNCVGTYSPLCVWLNNDASLPKQVIALINGVNGSVSPPSYGNPSALSPVSGTASATVYGFINNSMMVTLPGQPGATGPSFSMNVNIKLQRGLSMMPELSLPCGSLFGKCVGQLIGDFMYNIILRSVVDFFMQLVQQVVNALLMAVLYLPLQGMAQIFKDAVAIIQQPSVNPLIALANMGAMYINFSNEMWINILEVTVSSMALGPFGGVVMAIIGLVMPILVAWMGVMLSIGFICAYYVPFLPYMIFTFGTIAWLTAVIEAMVAGPIVALGVTHPEGHDAFGKGEQAIMILMNVFLRPSMMIIGFITAIAMSYVSVWIINTGFSNAVTFIQGSQPGLSVSLGGVTNQQIASNQSGYGSWAAVYGFFFSILIYTTMYLTVVQKSFQLITYLPDKVLRWIGGQPESLGQETAGWADESKGKVEKGGDDTSKASQQMDSQLSGYAMKGIGKIKSAGKAPPTVAAKGGEGSTPTESTPTPPEGVE